VVEYLWVFHHVGFFLRSLTIAMGAIGWIVLGLIAGYIAGTLVNKRGEAVTRIGGKLVVARVIARPPSDASSLSPRQ
jgi:hypothetical protein